MVFYFQNIVARFLAIDWDETECRYAVASLQNEKVAVRDVGIAPIDSEEFGSPLDALSMAVHSLCKEEKIGSCPILLSLGRSNVEWLQQKLPPCKETEISLLLKNQVLREISGSTEADPVDYLLLESSSEGHRVLGLTISQKYRRSLTRAFRALGYPPMRIGFRAANVAELILHNPELLGAEVAEPRLVVNTVGDDVDLIILADQRIAAVRSFRLPAESPQKDVSADTQRTLALADEIERTLMIGPEGSDPLPIQHIILFGDGSETKLPKHLAKIGLTVQVWNPLTLPNVSAPPSVNEPEKFAPLIGSLLVQAQKRKPVIDFLHPKEAPKPPNYTRPILLALALLGILCGGLYYWNLTEIRRLETQLAAIKNEHAEVAAELRQVTPGAMVLWQTHIRETQNVVWLDVLKDLSEVLPSGTDLVVSQMTFTSGPINNNPRFAGSITLHGMARDPEVLRKLQHDLHTSGRYWMQNPEPRPNPAGGGYPWWFRTTIYRLR
jgi:hypothetical protein